MNFKVNVRAGRATTVSHKGNDVAATHHVPHFDKILLIVCVTGNDSITMGHFNHFSIAVALTTPTDDTAGYSDYV